MTNLTRTVFAIVVLSAAAASHAQGANEPPMRGAPLIMLQNGVLNCGVGIQYVRAGNQPDQRILAMGATIHLDPSRKAVVVSFSAYDYLFKANVEETMASNRIRPVQTGWFGVSGHARTQPHDRKIQPLEPVEGVTYRTSNPGDVAILVDLLDGKPIEIGMRLSDSGSELVRSGSVLISSSDRLKVKSCLDVAMGTPNK